LEFLGFDHFHSPFLFFLLAADLGAFFKVLATVLQASFLVAHDLGEKLLGVLFADASFGLFLHALGIGGFLLRLDDAIELLLLLLSLNDHSDLLFLSLLLSCLIEVAIDLRAMLGLLAFLFPLCTLLGLRRSLSPQRVQLSLAISSLLLQLAQPLNFFLLLQLDALLLLDHLLLFPGLLDIIGDYLVILLTLDTLLLLLDGDRLLVGVFDFEQQAALGFDLFLDGVGLLFLEDLDLTQHLLPLLLKLLLLPNSNHLPLLDLILNDKRTLLAITGVFPLPFFVELDDFESLNFHH
jgi:hypothetical protein